MLCALSHTVCQVPHRRFGGVPLIIGAMSQRFPMQDERPVQLELREETFPLVAAAQTVYESVYQGGSLAAADASLLLERLDGVASAIACIADVYVRAAGAYRRVSAYELRTGLFRSGGNELYFKDGRASITDLFITRSGLESVLSVLQENQDVELKLRTA